MKIEHLLQEYLIAKERDDNDSAKSARDALMNIYGIAIDTEIKKA